MIKSHLKSVLKVACGLVLVFALLGLAACNNDTAQPAADENLIGTDTTQEIIYPAIRVGTLSTDDLLPLWVAQAEGLLEDAGLDVEIITFQSPPEQLAAITAGEVDALMTDMVVATLLHESGTPVRAVTKMAGAPAGIVAGPDSGIESLADLANVPVGASTPTVIEYIIDKALLGAGVPEDQIAYEVIPALSTRFQMLMEGNIKAAGLPWTLQSLAAQQGATV
ncbi:MAG: ABC transporter substrate-binding protein, partial [Coriobacteriia bacterium]|nr:ABC transporter substrate-binding protein [Coriobacteriia bacterium]